MTISQQIDVDNQMENEIMQYLSKYVLLSEELRAIIVESSNIKRFTKGAVLLK
jgi:hypothetical protein